MSEPQDEMVVDNVYDCGCETGRDVVTGAAFARPCAQHRGVAMLHRIELTGPIVYPGGKDGMWTAACIAGDWTSDFGTKPEVQEAGRQHAEAKNAVDANLAAFDQRTVDRVTLRIAVELAASSATAERVLAALNGCRRDVGLERITNDMLPMRGLG